MHAPGEQVTLPSIEQHWSSKREHPPVSENVAYILYESVNLRTDVYAIVGTATGR